MNLNGEIQIHNGDNLDVLQSLQLELDRCIFVTDPPFNVGYHYNEYEDKMEDEVVDEVKEVKEVEYVSKDDFNKAVAEIKAMYDALVEKMGSEDMGMEVPTEDLAKEELSSQVEEVEPIAHTPEVATEVKQNIRLASKRPMSTIDRVFAQLNQIKR